MSKFGDFFVKNKIKSYFMIILGDLNARTSTNQSVDKIP